MNRKGDAPLSTGFIILGFGLAVMALGVFLPDEGLIYKGIFSSMIIPMLMGIIFFIVGIGIFLNHFEMKRKAKANNWIGEKLIIQEISTPVLLFVGIMVLFVSFVSLAAGLLYPKEGVIYVGVRSEMMMAVIIGALFTIVGVVLMYFGVEETISNRVYKKLKNDGSSFTTNAKIYFEEFEKENIKGETTGFPYINISNKVVYRYLDETGIERISLSLDNYTEKQIEWFKNKNTIPIRCLKKRSIILEQPPMEKKDEEEIWEE